MCRDYCFTAWTLPFPPEEEKIRYMVVGKEICPNTNREHYQGYVVFNRTARIPMAKKWIGAGDDAHLEPRKGTRLQASEYCKKDGDFTEIGQLVAYTIEDVLKLPVNKIKEEWPLMYVRYHRGIEKLHAVQGAKWRLVEVFVLYGKTGTGKTREVMEMDDVFKIDPPYTWWDGYSGEDILLIDDFRTGDIARGMLLNLLDGYRLRLETKGGHAWALWSKVYITTNFNPEMWSDELLRRVTKKRCCG